MLRSVTRKLRGLAVREDILSTASLVKAYNQSENANEREVFREWLGRCHEYFANRSSNCLSAADALSYPTLAEIKPQCTEDQNLVRAVVFALSKRTTGAGYWEALFLPALEYALREADTAIFKKFAFELIHLSRDLLARLDPSATVFARETYVTHSAILSTFCHALDIVREVAPTLFDNQKKKGVYRDFWRQLKDIAESTDYYPLIYQIEIAKQSIERMTCESREYRCLVIGRRVYSGAKGVFKLIHAAREAMELKFDIDSIEEAHKYFSEAFAEHRIGKKTWYDLLRCLEEANLETNHLKNNEVFKMSFERVMEIQRTMRKGDERKALRCGSKNAWNDTIGIKE